MRTKLKTQTTSVIGLILGFPSVVFWSRLPKLILMRCHWRRNAITDAGEELQWETVFVYWLRACWYICIYIHTQETRPVEHESRMWCSRLREVGANSVGQPTTQLALAMSPLIYNAVVTPLCQICHFIPIYPCLVFDFCYEVQHLNEFLCTLWNL